MGKEKLFVETKACGNSDFQILPAMRAYFGMALVSPAAVKAKRLGNRLLRVGWGRVRPLFLFSNDQIKGKKYNQKEKNPDRPKESPPDRVPMLLGIEKNP